MAAYRYPLPRAYRRVRYPYKFRKGSSGSWPAAVIAGAVLLAGAGAGAKAVVHHAPKAPAPATANTAAADVIAFARSKVGKVPYAWGGTTDAGMDCSGLAQAAYASAGDSIERTSQEQWASERHVSIPVPGDLVFFAGSDGTPTSPGHVGIVVDPARHTMIDAFGAGTYVRQEGYGPAASPGTGLSAVVGFTDPAPSRKGA
jgi:cell wall-associated NlpC family hydrolase